MFENDFNDMITFGSFILTPIFIMYVALQEDET